MKIKSTSEMIFALYNAWEEHYGMHGIEDSNPVFTVSVQTWDHVAGGIQVTLFNPKADAVTCMFISDLVVDAREAFRRLFNRSAWIVHSKGATVTRKWYKEEEEIFNFIVSFWEERI